MPLPAPGQDADPDAMGTFSNRRQLPRNQSFDALRDDAELRKLTTG